MCAQNARVCGRAGVRPVAETAPLTSANPTGGAGRDGGCVGAARQLTTLSCHYQMPLSRWYGCPKQLLGRERL
jgi:hypothetical protein